MPRQRSGTHRPPPPHASPAQRAGAAMVPAGTEHSSEEIEQALLAYVMSGCNLLRTSKELGHPTHSLITSWVIKFGPRVDELLRKHGPELEQRAIDGFREFVLRSQEVKMAALDATLKQIEDGDCKDPSQTMKNIAIAQGIAVQKVLELTGRPTAIMEHRTTNEIVARLQAMGAQVEGFVDSTATPVLELPAGDAVVD